MRRPNQVAPAGRRAAAVTGSVLAAVLVLAAVAASLGLSTRYGSAQSWRAARLAEQPVEDLRSWRGTTVRDAAAYVPTFTVVLGALIVWLTPTRRWRTIALAALIVGALCDVVETTIFRRSLGRLLDGAAVADVDDATRLTAVFTTLKWVGLGGALAIAVVTALRGGRDPSSSRSGPSVEVSGA